MDEEERHKPGDIVAFILTGEKVMVRVAYTNPEIRRPQRVEGFSYGDYQIRKQDWSIVDCLEFEIACLQNRQVGSGISGQAQCK